MSKKNLSTYSPKSYTPTPGTLMWHVGQGYKGPVIVLATKPNNEVLCSTFETGRFEYVRTLSHQLSLVPSRRACDLQIAARMRDVINEYSVRHDVWSSRATAFSLVSWVAIVMKVDLYTAEAMLQRSDEVAAASKPSADPEESPKKMSLLGTPGKVGQMLVAPSEWVPWEPTKKDSPSKVLDTVGLELVPNPFLTPEAQTTSDT